MSILLQGLVTLITCKCKLTLFLKLSAIHPLMQKQKVSLYNRERTLQESFWPKSESPAVGLYHVQFSM